uniref:Uncharacterized protein n=1 Tax=Rhizophora mucronata TaxID=61149 RepID=A0A2P2Q719_RHIMU
MVDICTEINRVVCEHFGAFALWVLHLQHGCGWGSLSSFE